MVVFAVGVRFSERCPASAMMILTPPGAGKNSFERVPARAEGVLAGNSHTSVVRARRGATDRVLSSSVTLRMLLVPLPVLDVGTCKIIRPDHKKVLGVVLFCGLRHSRSSSHLVQAVIADRLNLRLDVTSRQSCRPRRTCRQSFSLSPSQTLLSLRGSKGLRSQRFPQNLFRQCE